MSEVVHARVDKALLARVDAMVEQGLFPNRSGAIREATREMVSKVFAQETNERMETVARASAAVIGQLRGVRVLRVLLYGSVARREARPESDVDLLVLVADGTDVQSAIHAVVKATEPISIATDTVVTPLVLTKGEFDRTLSDGHSFAKSAVAEGKVLLNRGGGS